MWHALLTSVATILLVTIIASYVVLRKAVSEPIFRRFLLLIVIVTPVITVIAIVKAIFSRAKPIRYSEELGRIEDEIEGERVNTFDDRIVHPSFSNRWRMAYLYALEKSASAAAKLDPSISNSLCGISQLR